MTKKETKDIVIIGGGAIGMAIANRLSSTHKSLVVLDSGEPGKESSWAASGSLSLIMPNVVSEEMRILAGHSESLWPDFVTALEQQSGMSTEYRLTELLRLVITDEDADAVNNLQTWLGGREKSLERVPVTQLKNLAPLLTTQVRDCYVQQDLANIRSPRFVKALRKCMALNKIDLRTYSPVLELLTSGNKITGVKTTEGEIHCGEVILAAGAWSNRILQNSLDISLPIVPIRGQMVLLDNIPVPLQHIVLGAENHYLIPRADGSIITGSTFEEVGFDSSITVDGINLILSKALTLSPKLSEARVANTWTGLRPQTPDLLPYIGRIDGIDGLIVATGHFRDGLLLTPVTTELVHQIIHGQPLMLNLAPYSPNRMVQ